MPHTFANGYTARCHFIDLQLLNNVLPFIHTVYNYERKEIFLFIWVYYNASLSLFLLFKCIPIKIIIIFLFFALLLLILFFSVGITAFLLSEYFLVPKNCKLFNRFGWKRVVVLDVTISAFDFFVSL